MVQGTKRRLLTARDIAVMKHGEWISDPAVRGAGVLQARKLSSGVVAFYFRCTPPNGERVRIPIGTGIDLAVARRKAAELSQRYQLGDRDLRGALESEQRELERAQAARAAAEAAAAAKKRATLGALLSGYVAQLRRDGKHSATAVEKALTRNVETPYPQLWATPAAEVTMDDLLPVIARLVNDGKLREGAKVRSYIRAAFAAAIRARQDARGLPELRALAITSNPARDLAPVEGSSKARERALSLAELRYYWRRISAAPDGAALRFHLLTGSQRIQQLRRLTFADYDSDAECVRLRDPKGRRKAPRIHDVPLIPAALKAMQEMGHEVGPYLFTLSHGETAATYESVRDRVVAIRDAMKEAGELEKGSFTVGDLRRTIETRLSAAGVSKETRAHLQSHGLGGVQSAHYDRHERLEEKRAALEELYRLVTGEAGTVTPMRRKRG